MFVLFCLQTAAVILQGFKLAPLQSVAYSSLADEMQRSTAGGGGAAAAAAPAAVATVAVVGEGAGAHSKVSSRKKKGATAGGHSQHQVRFTEYPRSQEGGMK